MGFQINVFKLVIILTLICEFMGPSQNAFSEKKTRIIAGDVTGGTEKMKIICADIVSVRLSYYSNFKWHMQICVVRCRAEQKYMPIFGTVTERDFRKKKSKAQKHIQMMQRCALDLLSAKRAW